MLSEVRFCISRVLRLKKTQPRPVPQIVLRCPVTNLDYTVGVRMDANSFASLPDMDMAVKCPQCGEEHKWRPREARLEDVTTIPKRRGRTADGG